MENQNKRLESLDVLRGIDLFVLIVLGGLVKTFDAACGWEWMHPIAAQFEHVPGNIGLHIQDMIMPLFLFMSGATIPFAMSKYIKPGGPGRGRAWVRLARRFVLLWIFGMIYAGNLLSFDPGRIVLYNNTLQAIAIGYLVASVCFLYTGWKVQVGITAALLVIHAALMSVTVDGYGGCYVPGRTFADYVGLTVQTSLPGIRFNTRWIIAAITYPATVMLGMFAGSIAKSGRDDTGKIKLLGITGASLLAAGLLLSVRMPVFKDSWNVSFVLVSGGISFLLLTFFYFIIDYKGWKKGWMWLKVFGMNSIVAYMIVKLPFSGFGKAVLYGTERFIGTAWYEFAIKVCTCLCYWIVLKLMYDHNKFLRL